MTAGRIGPYEIVAPIGAGGMGEVLRARDTKLGREVALKLLPAAFAQDAERVARFRREAQILASLNHTNIAAIFGLEEEGGTLALVMELVDGEDLAQRLKRGAIAVDEVIAIAKQIAEALEEAHERGIVHRDLEPANVKVTADGKVKVLDFGLAKAFSADPMSGSGSHDLSRSPTLAGAGTMAGVILGTAAYMSPEQARGKTVDRRADIWAFGVVLFEMLSGQRLFAGETVSDTLAAVLTREPEWAALPKATPAAVERLLRRCLERDVRRRLQSIGEARIALESPGPLALPPTLPPRRGLAAGAVIAGGLLLFAAGWLLKPAARGADATVRKLDLAVTGLEVGLGRTPSISPDGRRVAYFTSGRLWVRRLDQLDAVEIAAAEGARYTAWSPDGRQLAYIQKGRAWRVPVDGGAPTELGAVPSDISGSGGGAWTSDGRIVFAGSDTVGLWEVPAAFGTSRERLPLARDAEADFHEIAALPEAGGLIFTAHRKGRLPDRIEVLSGATRRIVLELPGESLRHPLRLDGVRPLGGLRAFVSRRRRAPAVVDERRRGPRLDARWRGLVPVGHLRARGHGLVPRRHPHGLEAGRVVPDGRHVRAGPGLRRHRRRKNALHAGSSRGRASHARRSSKAATRAATSRADTCCSCATARCSRPPSTSIAWRRRGRRSRRWSRCSPARALPQPRFPWPATAPSPTSPEPATSATSRSPGWTPRA